MRGIIPLIIIPLIIAAGILLWVLWTGKSVTTPRGNITRGAWKVSIFVTLNSLLFLALLGSLILYVTVYNGEDPLVLMVMYILFFPAFFIVGIALLILGRFFHVSTLNKWLPFIAIPGLFLPILLFGIFMGVYQGISDAGLLAGVLIAAVLCAFVIATTVKNLISQRGKVGSGNA